VPSRLCADAGARNPGRSSWWSTGSTAPLYEGGDSERAFTRLHKDEAVARDEVEARLEKEIRFDPDIWILEIEARDGQAFLDRIL